MPTIIVINCITGETIEREMNQEEYAQYLIDQEANATETE
jgi:hypothetical protein